MFGLSHSFFHHRKCFFSPKSNIPSSCLILGIPQFIFIICCCALRSCYWGMNFPRKLSYHFNRSHICLKINKVLVNNETTKLFSRKINPFIAVSFLSTDDNLQLEINVLSYGCLWPFTTHSVVSEQLKQGPIFSVKTY